MAIERWTPTTRTTQQEEFILKRCRKKRKLFVFLRENRHRLFDDALQQELEEMYRDTGAGKKPICPAVMGMALIMQGYLGLSDADAVEATVIDLRWQMVLDRLGSQAPAFSQGALCAFRRRLIEHDMDRRLLERTAELARTTNDFDAKKLPKTLRIAVDSSPLQGAGRVEDTINLIGHAARKVVECVAQLLECEYETAVTSTVNVRSKSTLKCPVHQRRLKSVYGQAHRTRGRQKRAGHDQTIRNLESHPRGHPMDACRRHTRHLATADATHPC